MTIEIMRRGQLNSGEKPIQGRIPDAESLDGEAKAFMRALAYTRITDYGMDPADARELLWRVATDESWAAVGEEIGTRQLERSRAAAGDGRDTTALEAAGFAIAAFNVAQAAYNVDEEPKLGLYRLFTGALEHYATLRNGAFERIDLPYAQAAVTGWLSLPDDGTAAGTVIVWGGLSGWGAAFLSAAISLNKRGLACILAEGPGQGLTRIQHDIHGGPDTLSGYGRFIDFAVEDERLGGPVGIQGNSFGGLLAARVAAADSRVAACVTNGGGNALKTPDFRAAREQIYAFTGAETPEDADAILSGLTLDPAVHRISCPLLVLRGDLDPVVPLAAQEVHLAAADNSAQMIVWPDGEHTIYNHAAERNAITGDWFRDILLGR